MSFLIFLRGNAKWLAAGVLLTFLSSFGQTFYISVYAGAIRDEFGLSHGAWGAIYTLATTLSAAAMIWAGTLTDRFRVRALGTGVLVALAMACLAMALVPVWWMLVPVLFALRFTGQGMAAHTAMVAMARWFVATRGRALAIAGMGFALAEAVLPLGFVALLEHFPWRWLWGVSAVVILLATPFLAMMLRQERTPQSMAAENPVAGMGGRHWTRVQALRHPLFWLILPVFTGPSLFVTALFFQQVHLAEMKGWSHIQLVALFPLYPVAGVLASVLLGWAVDRFGTARLIPVYTLPVAMGFVVLAQAEGLWAGALAMILIGATSGGQSTVPSAFLAQFYGTQNIGAIKSALTSAMVFGTALGPGISGVLIDLGLNFPDQMYGIALWVTGSAALAGWALARTKSAMAAEINVISP
jgi:MFS family permease